MTKKKRNHPDVDEILSRPWCYYCERDFDDLKVLINHQKAKHFKCERCGRRLGTAGGLSVHMSQVHKENLTAVDNALPNRAGLDIEIFGMEGIPEDIVIQHNQRVLTQFHQAEAERRANGGAGGAGGGPNGNATKKPKTEDISDIKKRLAEHKAAKLAAEQNGGGASGSATPVGAGQSQAPPPQATYQAGAPGYQQLQQPYAPPPSSTTTYAPPISHVSVQSPQSFQPPGYGQAASPVYGQPPMPQPYQQPPYGQPPQPYYQQPQQSPYPPATTFSPPPFVNQPPHAAVPFQPPLPFNAPNPYPIPPGGIPRPFAASVAPPHHHQQRSHSPAQPGLPQRTGSGSLPAAPGLPQRPAIGAPPVNAFQFQQMHQGQIPPPHSLVTQPPYSAAPSLQNGGVASPSAPSKQEIPNAASIDDLISSASKQAETIVAPVAKAEIPPPADTPKDAPKETASDDKAAKKDKDKDKEKQRQTRLVYSDNEISPEEKMAMLPKYAFTPSQTISV